MRHPDGKAASRLRAYRTAALALVSATLLSACAQTTVIRSPNASRGSATRPATTSPATVKPALMVTVKKGDTLYRIAAAQRVSALDLAMWNRIQPPYVIHPGQTLRLTPPEPPKPARPPTPPPAPVVAAPQKPLPGSIVRSPPTRPAANKPPIGQPATDKPPVAPATRPIAGASKPASTTPAPTTPAAVPDAGFRWRWPADGNVVGRFVAGDPTRQGIDISGKNGAAVRAAADGVVVYSGAGLVGYGELIIIKHNEQWLSAYGHNRARLVNEGQRVKAGDQIAEMGRSGASRDMLHFEIRYNGKPQDPLQALPKR